MSRIFPDQRNAPGQGRAPQVDQVRSSIERVMPHKPGRQVIPELGQEKFDNSTKHVPNSDRAQVNA